jgi:glycosyltransferase involved in cell wall biosynthesis
LRPFRILIITHSPLAAEFGAGQMAINLADALKAQGHDVTLWSPHPLEKTKWWQALQQMRSKADQFIAAQEPFDVIDSPASLITRRVRRKSALVVARSNQPDILYLATELSSSKGKSLRNIIRLPFNYLYTLFRLFLLLRGWGRANFILCLGTLELQWMRRRFPWWRSKLFSYVNALSASDQAALRAVRRQRESHRAESIRFLWIGRWAAHKGTDILLSFINDWSSERPQDCFTIAGCGAEAEKDCPAEMLESGRLKIIPSFTREGLYRLLANHDAGLFTSKVEGWGLSLNEMLESGMHVFATQAGATVDLKPFFTSLLQFPPTAKDIDNLSEPAIIAEYYDNFTFSRIAENYARLIFPDLQSEENLQLRTAQE